MDKLLSCLDARERRYQKGELVISAGTKISRFGVLLSGTVEIQQEDFQGNITIVAQITPGQLFAEAFVGAGAALPVAVLSTEPSVIPMPICLPFSRCSHQKYGENPSK